MYEKNSTLPSTKLFDGIGICIMHRSSKEYLSFQNLEETFFDEKEKKFVVASYSRSL